MKTIEALIASADIADARLQRRGGAWVVLARSSDGTVAGTASPTPDAALERAAELLRGRRA